jgi:hypothetical protein
MSSLQPTRWGIAKLYRFPYFQTREAFLAANGYDAPPFTADRPPKYWMDETARSSESRVVVYDPVIAYAANGSPLVGPGDQPVVESLALFREEAYTVNIPPAGANIPGASQPAVPVPLRVLTDEEELFFAMPGVVAVRLKAFQEPDRGFTEADRSLLQAIALRLGLDA